MTPIDIILWAGAFLIASVPVGIGVLIVGYCIVLIRREMKK
jgi:hypothetical protein